MAADRERIRLELVALPDEVPVHQRLKAALKTLLRRDRLKCIKVEPAAAELPAEAKEDKQS
jgi:hypothetical protein